LKNKINIKKIEKIKKYIDDLFDLDFKEKVLCHGDVQSKNIIFNYKTNKIS
jgi:thiamine kinase-like enzyme